MQTVDIQNLNLQFLEDQLQRYENLCDQEQQINTPYLQYIYSLRDLRFYLLSNYDTNTLRNVMVSNLNKIRNIYLNDNLIELLNQKINDSDVFGFYTLLNRNCLNYIGY